MLWTVGGAYFATDDSRRTYLHNLWLSESDGLREIDVYDKSVKQGRS